jgi:uncharacterized damage-inducible protein DinB
MRRARRRLVNKMQGMDEVQGRWKPTERASSLLTLIVHLTQVEQGWMEGCVLGDQEIDGHLRDLSDLFHDRDPKFYELVDMTTVAEAVDVPRTV